MKIPPLPATQNCGDEKTFKFWRLSELKSNFQMKLSGSLRLRVKESEINEGFFFEYCSFEDNRRAECSVK